MPSLVPRSRCWTLAPLFNERTELRAVVDSVLEGHLGRAFVDDPEAPGVARLDLGCYAIFGGDPFAPAARELIRTLQPPIELAFPDSEPWRQLIHAVHGTGVSDRSMRSYATEEIDPGELARWARQSPRGFEMCRVGAADAARLNHDHRPHAMQTFDSADDFAARGIGFCAKRLEDEAIACVASSYAICTGRIELAIATHPDYRRRGLARTVASRLVVHCLERAIVPHWNAADPLSRELAVKLGYRPAGTCEILFLQG